MFCLHPVLWSASSHSRLVSAGKHSNFFFWRQNMQCKALSIATIGHALPPGIVEHILHLFLSAFRKDHIFKQELSCPSEQEQKQGNVCPPAFCPAELKNKAPQGHVLYRERFIMPHTVRLEWNHRWNEKSRPKLHSILLFGRAAYFRIVVYVYNSHQWD